MPYTGKALRQELQRRKPDDIAAFTLRSIEPSLPNRLLCGQRFLHIPAFDPLALKKV